MFSHQTELHDLKAENERLRADVERLYQEVGKLMADKSHLMMFLGYAVTCRQHNRAKWMQRFTANLNECLEAIGDTDRAYWKEYADVIVVYNPHEKEE